MKRKVVCDKNLRPRSPIALLLALFCFIDRFKMNDVLYGMVWTLYAIFSFLFMFTWVHSMITTKGIDVLNEKN